MSQTVSLSPFPKPKFYLCGSYERKEEFRQYRDSLTAELGWRPVCRWMDENHPPTVQIQDVSEDFLKKTAAQDFQDIRFSDWVIVFTEPSPTHRSRGGRHVELGYALALEKHILIIGPRENIFCYLDRLPVVSNWLEAISFLKGR